MNELADKTFREGYRIDLESGDRLRAYEAPGSFNHSNLYVPKSLRRALREHIAENASHHASTRRPPLFFGIQGPTRNGKTFMSRIVLSRSGYNVVRASASEFSGRHEGDATRAFADFYRAAGGITRITGRLCVALVDDVDRSIVAKHDNTSNTVNTQLLEGMLQNLADDPWTLLGEKTERIPIILTGNDFSALSKPLLGPGRLRLFTWDPSWRTKARIVAHAFQASDWLTRHRIRRLVSRYPNQPIEFFHDLKSRSDVLAPALDAALEAEDGPSSQAQYDAALPQAFAKVNVRQLNKLARRQARECARNYLSKGGKP
jgi:hypothetical protein